MMRSGRGAATERLRRGLLLQPVVPPHSISSNSKQPATMVLLNYQRPPPDGFATGRYIDQEDRGDVIDESDPRWVPMYNARALSPPATLSSHGFACQTWPTAVTDFDNEGQLHSEYYEEIVALVKHASGATRVVVFDHTRRTTGAVSLNAAQGGTAAPVPRIHCDYTEDGAPRRLRQLGVKGMDGLSAAEVEAIAAGSGRRYAFINAWRSLDTSAPVQQHPLAVVDARTVHPSDRFLYELRFPDRTGQNYSLRFSTQHQWYTYPAMGHEEVLLFTCFDTEESAPRFVFHSAFDSTSMGTTVDGAQRVEEANIPRPRRSLELRTIAFW